MSITNKQNNNTGRDSGAKDTKIETVSEEVKYAKKFVILKVVILVTGRSYIHENNDILWGYTSLSGISKSLKLAR